MNNQSVVPNLIQITFMQNIKALAEFDSESKKMLNYKTKNYIIYEKPSETH